MVPLPLPQACHSHWEWQQVSQPRRPQQQQQQAPHPQNQTLTPTEPTPTRANVILWRDSMELPFGFPRIQGSNRSQPLPSLISPATTNNAGNFSFPDVLHWYAVQCACSMTYCQLLHLTTRQSCPSCGMAYWASFPHGIFLPWGTPPQLQHPTQPDWIQAANLGRDHEGSNQAAPCQAAPGQAAPAEASPSEAAPAQAAPAEASPSAQAAPS